MSSIVKWGILGPGKIAKKFANDLITIPNAKLTAVGSRSMDRAESFATEYQVENVYDSYDALVNSPDVDVIYIATPHTYHFDHAKMCLAAGKHVLCEKPMGINAAQVVELSKIAREAHLFLMEAMWTAYLPAYRKMKSLIKDGTIGNVRLLTADFGFYKEEDPEHRLFNPSLAGGALLDVGIYPVFAAVDILGAPKQINSLASMAGTGVDQMTSVQMSWASGAIAQLNSSVGTDTTTALKVYGKDKYLKMDTRWHESHTVELHDRDGLIKHWQYDYEWNGYRYEAESVMNHIIDGKTISGLVPLSLSTVLHDTLDTIRGQIGLRYPME